MASCKICRQVFTAPRTLAKFVCHWRQRHPGRSNYMNDFECDDVNELSVAQKRSLKFEQANHSCVQCGFNVRRDDGTSILQIDHIDGDHTNNEFKNLRVLCPNCHALTSTFGPGNRQYGRNTHRKMHNIERQQFDVQFITQIEKLHAEKKVDFTKYGWVKLVAEIINEAPQVTGRRIRRLMPEFYHRECFRRGYHNPRSSAG